MTENGGTLFTLGTKTGDTITQDAEDVPFTQILLHVTPSELSRFENADYEAEDEAERIHLANMKPRGRPRKDGAATANGLVVPKTPKPKPSGPASGGYSAFRGEGQPKKRGRPVGWRKHGVPAAPGGPVPSFNGPQPTGEADTEPEMSTREQTEDLAEKRLDLQAKTGVYSMVSASGLGPQVPDGETELDTREPTREHTPLLTDEIADEPTPKRRRVDVDASSPSTPFETAPPSPVLQSRSTSDEDERINLLDQFTAPAQQVGPNRAKNDISEKPKQPHQSTSTAQPDRSISSSSDEDERLNPLDQFTSNAQQNAPHRPKDPPPKQVDQSTIKAQPNRANSSSSEEDERLNLLDQFTAKPDQRNLRSNATSSQDSMLSSVHYVAPAKQHPGRPPKIPPSRQALRPTKSTTTPQRLSKRTSLTPHYPGSVGGVIPIPSANHDSSRRRFTSTTSPSKTRFDNKSHRRRPRAVPANPLSPSKPATTTPAPPYRPTSSTKPRQPPSQQQRPNTHPTNPSNPNTTPRPSTRSSSSLNTYQADTVRAMDSYFSPRKHITTNNRDRNIDPRLRSSRTASFNSDSEDAGEEGSGESFMGVAEVPRSPAPARPPERKATAVKVVVVSPAGGKGGASGGAGVAGKGARGLGDSRTGDRRPQTMANSPILSQNHGMVAEQRNGTNSNANAWKGTSDEEESKDDDSDDDDEGSIEL